MTHVIMLIYSGDVSTDFPWIFDVNPFFNKHGEFAAAPALELSSFPSHLQVGSVCQIQKWPFHPKICSSPVSHDHHTPTGVFL